MTPNTNRRLRRHDPTMPMLTTGLLQQHLVMTSRNSCGTMLRLRHGSEDCSPDDALPVQRTTSTVARFWDRFVDTTADVTTERNETDEGAQSTRIPIFSTLGVVGINTSLMLLSILLVKGVYTIFYPRDKSDEEPAGMLNRCPWPFIIFHDSKQFLKDSPTWMIVTWIALRSMLKVVKSTSVVG